jgi:hypothetical protein
MSSDALAIQVERHIYLIRSEKVMLDADLAWLYGVETKVLNKAVKRNKDRFPTDFIFQLTQAEAKALRLQIGTSKDPIPSGIPGLTFQIGTSKSGRGGRRYLPYAFTEQGVAMLSSVLRSPRAVQVNIAIMRTFVRFARDASFQCRSRAQIERIGKEVRRTVQGRFRCDSRVNDSAGKAKTPDWIPFP